MNLSRLISYCCNKMTTTYQVVELSKENDILRGRIVKLEDKVVNLTYENSRMKEMLDVYKSNNKLNKQNDELVKKLSNELVRKWRIEDEMLMK